ncbi:MAG: hypothetical protein HYV09_00140 [Deltaproteobacteria bacterium]|nr:hypothetical protein [Deltaproteobacteria bacterium]
MIGVWAIARRGDGRAVWSVWFGRRPTRARFEASDARGVAIDEHAARQAAFAAFTRARGVTRWEEIDPMFAVADDRLSRGVDPVFPGDRPRGKRELGRGEIDRDVLEALGLEPPVTLARARAAYKARALVCHPDRGGTHEQMLSLNRAFAAICDALGSSPAATMRPKRSGER